MTVNDLAAILSAEKLNVADGERIVKTGYCGDLLSFVMGRAPSDSAWFTVMTNVNICAVATLTDVSVIVVCEGSEVSDDVINKASEQCINLIACDADVFTAVKKVCNESQI